VIDLGNGVKLVTRAEWGARPPRSTTHLNPTYGSTAHWEGPHMGTFPHSSCAPKVRGIQAFHMDNPDRRWSDIAYTALACPHGYVYQGRWVGVRTAANGTNTGNDVAYAVCYLSGEGDAFTDLAKRAMRQTMDYLDRFGGAGPHRNCHRDWKQTACPGDVVCAWVRAGQPVPGPPTPPPTPPTPAPPTPTPSKEDDMLIITNEDSGASLVVTGGVSFGFGAAKDKAAMIAAGIPSAPVSAATFRRYEAVRSDDGQPNAT
jgi:hypothetical protein